MTNLQGKGDNSENCSFGVMPLLKLKFLSRMTADECGTTCGALVLHLKNLLFMNSSSFLYI